MNKLRMISGFQPTNNLTLGNYLGTIHNFVQLQDQYQMYIFIADLHSITTNNEINLNANKLMIAKTLFASGLDLSKVVIFNQSDVLEHTLLGHIMLCHTTIGELSRMTQFKDKAAKSKAANGTEYIPTGLLTYPALMAADILLYDSDVVMVGQDQKQHLELTRTLATRLNNLYKAEIFKLPDFLTDEKTTKILDLVDPTKKMSKSATDPKGVIFLNDSQAVIEKKIMGALTDNLNQVKHNMELQPGITNLINIYCSLTGKSIQAVEQQFEGVPNYGKFKQEVASVVSSFVTKLWTKIEAISDEQVHKILTEGAQKAKFQAHTKMELVLKTIGFK